MADAAGVLSSGLERNIAGYALRRVLCSARGAFVYEALELERKAQVTLVTVPVPETAALPNLAWLNEGHFTCFPRIEKVIRGDSEVRLVLAAFAGESVARVLARDGPFAPGAAARLLLQLLRDFEEAGDARELHRALGATLDWLLLRRDDHDEWQCYVPPLGLLEASPLEHEAESPAPSEMELLGMLLGMLVGQANIVATPDLAALIERLFEQRPERKFEGRRELMTALAPLTRNLSGSAPILDAPPRFNEEVQVTVFRPKAIVIGRWYRLLAFVHLAERRPGEDSLDPIAEVRRIAQAALGEQIAAYRSATEDSLAGLPEGGQINLVPEVDGVEFNPPSRSFAWHSDVHDESFQLRAKSGGIGSTLRGRLSAYLGTVLLAEVGMAFKLQSSEAADAGPFAAERGKAYRKIFASYSHADARIVSDFEAVVSAFGDRYLIDVKDLRAGETWSEALARLIDQADVFQLFWSKRSMSSEFCRREWEYALEKGVSIRPVYWERPMPDPPKALKGLHFAAFGGTGSPDSPDIAEPPSRRERAPDSAPKAANIARKLLGPVVALSALVLWVGLHRSGLSPMASAPRIDPLTPPAGATPPAQSPEVEAIRPQDPELRARDRSRPDEARGGGGIAPGILSPCDCPPGDPLCDCPSRSSPVRSPASSPLRRLRLGGRGPALAARTCFVEGVANAPLYPQLSGPLNTEARCVGRNLASYQLSDLPPQQARIASNLGCALVVLHECGSPRNSLKLTK